MKNSLTKKLFVITLSSFLLLLLTVKVIQSSFFQYFYYEKKIESTEKELRGFKLRYSNYNNDKDNLKSAMMAFENKSNNKIGIFSYASNSAGNLLFIANYENESYTKALFDDIYSEIVSEYPTLISDIIKSGKCHSIVLESKKRDETYIVSLGPMNLITTNDSIAIVISSVKSISEASSVLNDFFLYILGVSMFISIIVAILYSYIIAKPLKQLNKVASKMASLDFSETCVVDREDEIGGLANSLNSLSENLNNALNDLKVKNKKLKDDIDKERNLEKMRKDFVAGVSHELKTPIGIIQGYAEGIKDGLDKNKTNEYLDIIIDESNKMNKLVLNMLELSKLESGSLKPNMEKFNLIRCIRKVLRKWEKEFLNHNLNLIYNNSFDYIYVHADPFQIEQVLENFITNALKYTPENNDVIINLSLINDKVLFSIENKGTNIPNDKLKQIWNYFYRADESRRRKDGSTGLGLAIVKNILELHDSNFAVENTNDGVRFYFDLNVINDN